MNDAVVSHHMNPFRSGVARFNELLAEQLGVPFVSLADAGAFRTPLLSFKCGELSESDCATLEAALSGFDHHDVFLHEWSGHELEQRLVAGARRVLCGNRAIAAQAGGHNGRVETLWTPGLILEDRTIAPTEVSVFTFGMAHKLRTDQFRRLRDLLDSSGRSYAIHVSAANHETATMRDAELVFDEMAAIFPDRMYFLGNLSDLAVVQELRRCTFFAAFFVGGVRANNTSVASAMERGAVVITNLDAGSPVELAHMDNVIDIDQTEALPFDALALGRISVRAMETRRELSWDALVQRLRG
ncbi:MAG: hypothetical protein QOD69_2578 [Solirubrobacteraceae bacterium]|jgi:hypothetical protein|nr:hypothetical protein [Solirubrobacteraceae bacterium]